MKCDPMLSTMMKLVLSLALDALPSALDAQEVNHPETHVRAAVHHVRGGGDSTAQSVAQHSTTHANPSVTRALEDVVPSNAEIRKLPGCVNVGVYQKFYLKTIQADNINIAIGIANSGSPSANLCWSGTPINDEATLQTAVSSGSIDFLLAFNWDFQQIWSGITKTAVASALTAGTLQKLMVYDRYASNDVKFPGLAPGNVFSELSQIFIEPISPLDSPNEGPAGTVGTWSGCSSHHGYIVPVSALPQAEFHFRRPFDLQPVSVQFCYDQKLVYYSTTPQDAFLDNGLGCSDPIDSANKLFANTLWKIATESCCLEAPTTYYLWNAATDTLVSSLENGGSYCINYKYNIEARVGSCPTLPVGIKIWPQGGNTIARAKEDEAPYYLWGNNDADVLPNKKALPAGVYHVSNLDSGDQITFTQTCAIYTIPITK